ncbi:hypothetical protein CPS_4560 [Colwellia psychrerythraea 34H]|uniref:Uncharacterized protein n=1 Tax=Colwellia psychrerythraea (strain 34H / ATCC BAA-681) TaxID=167879 RepID=Q47VG4_COLP3|nr:hypothetical protein CPS_4560 [Colwellia psychrerythraea 34H]
MALNKLLIESYVAISLNYVLFIASKPYRSSL